MINEILIQMDIPLKIIKYIHIPNVKITLQGNELFIQGPEGSVTIKLTPEQVKDAETEFMHLTAGH